MTLRSLAIGRGGNLWMTASSGSGSSGAKIVKYVAANGSVERFPLPNADSYPTFMTLGSDENLWFFEQGRQQFGRITSTGQLIEFPAGFKINALTSGVDGNLWFVQTGTGGSLGIGKIAPAGAISTYSFSGFGARAQGGIPAGSGGRMYRFPHVGSR